MTETPLDPRPAGCALAAGYAALFLAWYVGVSLLVQGVAGYAFITSAAGLSVLVVGVGVGGVVLGDRLGRLLHWTPAWTWGFGDGPPQPRILAAAALGGLSLGVPGGWLAEHVGPPLKEALHWPAGNDALATLGGALVEGPLVWRAAFVLVVVLVGPAFEELIFRGVLWRTLRDRGAAGAVLISSGAFALYHLDPAQAVGVLPLALFLGVLRLVSGSVVPCLLAHAVNNGLATLLALTTGMEAATPPSLALLGTAVGLAAFALLATHPRRAPSPAEVDSRPRGGVRGSN